MLTKRIFLITIISAISMYIMGCANPNETAKNAGKPIGGALSVPQSVSEGAAEGYSGSDRQPNPYGR